MSAQRRLDWPAMVRNFDTAARDYERVAGLQREVAGRLAERLDLLRIRPLRVLDLGAGTGIGARLLQKRFPRARFVQLDCSWAMLDTARRRAPRWFSRHSFLCADAAALPLADRSFELVFSSLMLHWCGDLGRALREQSRVLRGEGLLLFSACGPDTLRELRQSWAAADDGPHVNAFPAMQEIGDALIRAGLEEPVLDTERLILRFPDVKALARMLRQLGARNVALERRRGLAGKGRRRRMLDAYEGCRGPDGLLPATFEIIYGHAWRPKRPAQPRPAGPAEAVVPLSALRLRRGATDRGKDSERDDD